MRESTTGETPEYFDLLKKEKARLAKEHANDLLEQLNAEGQPTRTVREMDRLIKRGLAAQEGPIEAQARANLLEQGIGLGKTELTFAEARALRQQLDKTLNLNKQAGELNETGQIVRQLRDQMERSLDNQIAEKVSPDMARQYVDTKLRYRDWKQVTDLLKSRMGVSQGNRFVSLTDTVAAAEGAAHAGPLGAITGFIANKTIRSPQASRLAAEIADKLAGDRAILSAGGINREASNAVGKTAESIQATMQKAATPIAESRKAAAYQVQVALGKSAASFAEFQKNLQSSGNTTSNEEQSQRLAILDGQPGLQAQVAMAQTQAQQIATSALPHADQPVNPALGEHQPPPPESAVHDYAELVKLLDSPKSVLDKFADGTLTRAQIAALNQALPLAMQQLQQHALEGLAQMVEKGKTPDYQTRLRLGLLTGKPVDTSDNPKFTSTIQSMYQQNPPMEAPPKQAGGGRRRSANQTKLSDRRESSIDRFNQ